MTEMNFRQPGDRVWYACSAKPVDFTSGVGIMTPCVPRTNNALVEKSIISV